MRESQRGGAAIERPPAVVDLLLKTVEEGKEARPLWRRCDQGHDPCVFGRQGVAIRKHVIHVNAHGLWQDESRGRAGLRGVGAVVEKGGMDEAEHVRVVNRLATAHDTHKVVDAPVKQVRVERQQAAESVAVPDILAVGGVARAPHTFNLRRRETALLDIADGLERTHGLGVDGQRCR